MEYGAMEYFGGNIEFIILSGALLPWTHFFFKFKTSSFWISMAFTVEQNYEGFLCLSEFVRR
jgi:hypothetical protein